MHLVTQYLSRIIHIHILTGTGIKMMDAMYFQKKKLETVFYFFDSNGDGRISREEFHKGDPSPHCAVPMSYVIH